MSDYLREKRNYAARIYQNLTGEILDWDRNGNVKSTHNNHLDAFIHAFTSGSFSMKYGEAFSKTAGNANEWKVYLQTVFGGKQFGEKLQKEANMDFWNNAAGINLARGCNSEEELAQAIVSALKNGDLITDLNDNRKFTGGNVGVENILETLMVFSVAMNFENIRNTYNNDRPNSKSAGTPPSAAPTKGPSGTGSSPTSGGASSSNQAPFTKASSSPTRTYTHPSTTPINTPNFAPAFSSRAPINTPNFAPTFRSGNANPFSSHRPAPTFNPFPVPNFSPFAEFKRSREPSTSRPSSPFPPINRPTSSSSYRQQQPSFNSQSNTPTYYPSYGSYYGSYNRMNDPTWLYTRASARDFGAYRSFYNARSNLGSNYNRENFYRTAGGMGSDWYNYYGTGQQNARSRMGSARSASWTQNMQGSIRYAASHVSPLVLDLNCNNEIELLSYKDGVYFDIDNDGFAEKIGWTKPEDGQLARDVNHNGKIDDITKALYKKLDKVAMSLNFQTESLTKSSIYYEKMVA